MSALVGVGRVGVAGWNTYRCWFETFPVVAGGLGTLLGPEKTPGLCGVLFSGPPPGLVV